MEAAGPTLGQGRNCPITLRKPQHAKTPFKDTADNMLVLLHLRMGTYSGLGCQLLPMCSLAAECLNCFHCLEVLWGNKQGLSVMADAQLMAEQAHVKQPSGLPVCLYVAGEKEKVGYTV